MEGKKIIECMDYKREFKTNKLNQNEFEMKYKEDIHFESSHLLQGIKKIALNYAILCGIAIEDIAKGISTKRNKVKEIVDIKLDYEIYSFYPLNPFDEFIEMTNELELAHTLILFTSSHCLSCYVDLFNTIQFYIILSNEWNGDDVYRPYIQKIEQYERKYPELSFTRYKHILPVAMEYNVEPNIDLEVFKKSIHKKIDTEPYEREFYSYYSSKMNLNYSPKDMDFRKDNLINTANKLESIQFYMDDDDRLRPNKFRVSYPTVNDNGERKILDYVDELRNVSKYNKAIKEYRILKQKKLFCYLSKKGL